MGDAKALHLNKIQGICLAFGEIYTKKQKESFWRKIHLNFYKYAIKFSTNIKQELTVVFHRFFNVDEEKERDERDKAIVSIFICHEK